MSVRQHEPIRLTHSDGGELVGDLNYTGTPGEWAVLWVHGFGSHRGGEKALALESACDRRGWTFAAFDFRGHGQSSGTLLDLRASGLLNDLSTIQSFLASRGVQRIGLVGSSMGGFAAAWFALRCEAVVACVLLAPALRFMQSRWESLTPEQREEWRRTGRLRVVSDWVDAEVGYGLAEEREAYPMGRLAAEWSKPLLIFHGMRDSTIPFSTSVTFAEATACPQVELRLLKDGDHRLTAFKDAIAEDAVQFLERWG